MPKVIYEMGGVSADGSIVEQTRALFTGGTR